MHAQARQGFIRAAASARVDLRAARTVLDLGGRNVNGTVHDLLPNARIDVLDITPGSGVTIVADARTWRTQHRYDLVVSTELLEHLDGWPQALTTAASALGHTGCLLLTAAAPPRPPHGAHGAAKPGVGEHYENVDPVRLASELRSRFTTFGVEYNNDPADVYAWARP